MYIMLSGYVPFYGEHRAELYRKIRRGDFDIVNGPWMNTSREAKNLIRKMIVVNASNRLTIAEVLRHPWFAECHDQFPTQKLVPIIQKL